MTHCMLMSHVYLSHSLVLKDFTLAACPIVKHKLILDTTFKISFLLLPDSTLFPLFLYFFLKRFSS